ncbi:MAG: 23S rRNA (guanosine(2251)-2'-O)-methyltransferase RlmB [Bacilli bacterium]
MNKQISKPSSLIIYGKNPVREALKIENNVLRVFILEGLKDTKLIDSIKEHHIPFTFVNKSVLYSKTKTMDHQGVVAEIKPFNYSSLEEIIKISKKKVQPLILMLDGIEDPHNFGAIIRSAEAFAVDGIIIKKHNQVEVNSTVMKVATGAASFVKICMVNNLNQTIDKLKQNGFWIVSTDGSASSSYKELSYDFPVCLVIGSEGFGISKSVLSNSDYLIKIPMLGQINSLNASVACSIFLSYIRK